MASDIQNLPGTGINSDYKVYSNFYSDNFIIQNTCIGHPKTLIIDVIRKHFCRDNIYTYRFDEYGFPLTPDLTGKDIDDVDTTKILISDVYRYEVKFYPAITVKAGGGSYKPLSFNQNATLKYRKDIFENEFGQFIETKTPTHRVYAGLWDMSFDINIYSESHTELEEISEIVSYVLQYSSWNELRANGLFIQSTSISAENAEPYANDYVYNFTITVKTLSEWRVEIPLDNIIEKLVFYFDSTKTPGTPELAAELQSLKFDDIVELAEITL